MRKVGSLDSMERRRRRNILALSIVMLAIMVLGTVGYSVSSRPDNSQNLPSNLIEFNGQTFSLVNLKENVAVIELEISKTFNDYSGKEVYVDVKNDAAYYEIISTLGKFARVRPACYGSCEDNLPEKSCEDNMIVWRDSTENRVYQENNCIFIDGDLKAVDAFLYDIFSEQ